MANYIAAPIIFLKDNALPERELKPEDIKPRLLDYWGTCPELNEKMLFVIDPGSFTVVLCC